MATILKYVTDVILFTQQINSSQKVLSVSDTLEFIERLKGPKYISLISNFQLYESLKVAGYTISVIDTITFTDRAVRVKEYSLIDDMIFTEEFSIYGKQLDTLTLTESLDYEKLTIVSDTLTINEIVSYKIDPGPIVDNFVLKSYLVYYIVPATGNIIDIILPH